MISLKLFRFSWSCSLFEPITIYEHQEQSWTIIMSFSLASSTYAQYLTYETVTGYSLRCCTICVYSFNVVSTSWWRSENMLKTIDLEIVILLSPRIIHYGSFWVYSIMCLIWLRHFINIIMCVNHKVMINHKVLDDYWQEI